MDNKASVTVINPHNAPKEVDVTGDPKEVVLIPPRGRQPMALTVAEQEKYRKAGLIVNPR